MERKIAGLETDGRNSCKQLGTHSIAGMRPRSSVNAVLVSSFLQFKDIVNDILTILRLSSEHFQERPRVHRGIRLALKRVAAIADVTHCRNAAFPHLVHPEGDVRLLFLHRRSVAHFIDLVNEPRHSGTFAELSLQVGQFQMAMRIHKARNNRTLMELRLRLRILHLAYSQDSSVIGNFHIGVSQRL